MKKIMIIALFIIISIGISSCMLEELFGSGQSAVVPDLDITVVPNNPSYVGQSLKVRISTFPVSKVSYIKVTVRNFITGEETILPMEKNVTSAEFVLKVSSSEFGFYVEIPGRLKKYGKEVWWPSKDNPLKVRDSSPPEVSLNVFRISENTNQYDISLDVNETQSLITRKWITVDDQPIELDGTRLLKELSVGNHVIRGYAKNEFDVVGSSFNNYLEVSPPKGDSYISFNWSNPQTITTFKEERVDLIAEIYDRKSYMKKVEVLLPSGGKKRYNFDPLIPSFDLSYSFTALESGQINVIATNGNDKTQTSTLNLVVDDHKAPKVVLTPNTAVSIKEGEVLPFKVKAESQSNSKIEKLFFLVDGSTAKSMTDVFEIATEMDYPWTVKRGKHTIYAIAIDERGAKGYSDSIEITGLVDDKEPPVIQLFIPAVAYTGIETNISCSIRDIDSGLSGLPEIKVVEDDRSLIPQTFDNSFYFAKWTPGSIGLKTISVTARDNAGNTDTKQAVIEVKDPTGIVLPTILDLGAYPNPVYRGESVKISVTVIPPSKTSNITPIIEFQVIPANGTGISITGVTKAENVYSASYKPENSGIHNIVANIQWGDYSYTKTGTFEVLSPEPGSDFTVEPTVAYLGDNVTLWLNPYTDNPNASITVQSMAFDSKTLNFNFTQNEITGHKIYFATASTIDSQTGNRLATARFSDNFGNIVNKQSSVYLRMPVLGIAGLNINSMVGSEYQAYTPVSFELLLDKTYPETLVPTGRIRITDIQPSGSRKEETIELTKHATDSFILVSKNNWLPPAAGNYLVEASVFMTIGSQTLDDILAENIVVNPAAIDITLNSSPVSIERITVGREVSLDFLVTGIPDSDHVSSFQYAIFKGNDIYVKSRTLQETSPGLYRDSLDPFLLSDNYHLTATITTVAPSVKAKHWDFFVLPSEIRKKTFKLDGNANNLVYGKDMYFDLELENPNRIENLSIKMFLVDENRQKLANVDPITAEPDSEFKIFRNKTPFRMYNSAHFTVAASVSIEEVPQIDLPAMYGDSIYFMPEPNVSVFFDNTNKYYDGFISSLSLTVTKPSNMNIQVPKIKVLDGGGNVNPVPYATDVSDPSSHYYDFYITPEKLGDIIVEVNVYESDDLNFQNPVSNATTTLHVEEFQPKLIISGGEGVNEFIQAKNPGVLVEISEIPEFFDGQYTYMTRLDGNQSKNFPIFTEQSSALISFDYNYLFNKLGAGAVLVTSEVQAAGKESFTVQGSRTFDVRLPSVSNSRFPASVINKTYHAFSESSISVEFNNNDKVTENLNAYLYIFDPLKVSTSTYNSVMVLSLDSVNAQAVFNNVVFPDAGEYQISSKIFCSNSSPEAYLDKTGVETVHVENIGTFVDIKYPYSGEEIFVGNSLRPKAVLTNIPNVLSVRFAIFDSAGATVVSNGRAALNTEGEWEMLAIDSKPLNKTGDYIVRVTVASEDVDEMTKENNFKVIVGHFSSMSLNRETGGNLIFTGEPVTFKANFTLNNPYMNPSTNLMGIRYDQATPTTHYFKKIGDTEKIKDGEVWRFTDTWVGNDTSVTDNLDAGKYIIMFTASLMDTTIEASSNITVLSPIVSGEPTLSPEIVKVSDKVNGVIKLTVPQNVVDYCNERNERLSNYIIPSITFENCDPDVLSIQEVQILPNNGVDYIVRQSATAAFFSGSSETKTFRAIFKIVVDGTELLTETLMFTIDKSTTP